MKKTSGLFAALLMACSAGAMAQSSDQGTISPNGGTAQGVGTGMTRTQGNSTTMGSPNAMGNGGGTGTVSAPRPYIDNSTPTTTSNGYPATSPSTAYPSGSPSTGGISNSGPSTSPAHNQ
jgi:hypothetical protein